METILDFSGWKWLNESRLTEDGAELTIAAPPKTDWFNNPVPEDGELPEPVANAPSSIRRSAGISFSAPKFARTTGIPTTPAP